jgi:3-hydroxyisobutyrate dehydrogenase-like beta-hydroxyacid dehydrogenase
MAEIEDSEMAETLGFIGLGNMGEPIAASLMAAGYGLRVYNRTASKAAALQSQGAVAVRSAADVGVPGGAVLTMVADDHAVEELSFAPGSFVERLGPGGLHVSISTIAPVTARKLAEHHARHGVAYSASPVFGRPDAAAVKRLWVCVSGPAAARERAKAILSAIGQGIFDFGEDPGAANVAKLCGNFMIAANLEALAELLALAEKSGVNKKTVAEVMATFSPMHKNYAHMMADQAFSPAGFRLALGFKDINLVLQTAAASETPMPLASLLHDRWISAMAKGRSELDWCAVTLGAAGDAGLKPRGIAE